MIIVGFKACKEAQHCPLSRQVAWTVSFATALLAPHSGAAEWKIKPSINLRETYTDNVNLAAGNEKKSSFVTEISPGVSITGSGAGLKVQADYVMQNLLYANGGNNSGTRHQLNAFANAELVKDLFFLDSSASISQQNISPFGVQSAGTINNSDNTSEVRTYSISPYFKHNFGNIATSEVRYTHDSVSAGTGSLADSQGNRLSFNVNSGTSFSTIGWGLQYNKQKVSSSNNIDDVDNTSYSGTLRYLITPRFSLTATAGHEKFNYVSVKDKPEDNFWSVGFSWAPTTRTSVMASTGKRFFGTTYSLAANHRSRNTVWSLGYDEDITSTRSQFLLPATISTSSFLNNLWTASIPDPVARQRIVDIFIRNTGIPRALSDSLNYFTNQYFLQKRLQASVAVNSAKSTAIFSVFNTLREAQMSRTIDSTLLGTSNLNLQDDTRQVGGNAIWNWRISSRSDFNISAGYSRVTSLTTDRIDHNKTLSLALSKRFTPDLTGTIELRRLQQNSNQNNGNIRETAISASILIIL